MVIIRLFGSLSELTNGKYLFSIECGVNQTIKDCIERLGIPHTEVSFITLNKDFVDFSWIVQDGDMYFVYPDNNLGIESKYLCTPSFIDLQVEPKFILDIHLGKLARLLRMFGIYAEYGMIDDKKILKRALEESLIILTRDRKLLMHKEIKFGYILRSDFPEEQFKEVYTKYSLKSWVKPFTRCLECNGKLEIVEKSYVIGRVPYRVFEMHDTFAMCDKCGKIYWGGSHYEHMKELIKTLDPTLIIE